MIIQGYNQYNFEANFRIYLLAENISQDSIKNYLSDLRHFIGWLENMISNQTDIKPTLDALPSILTSETISSYKSYLDTSNIPERTINRRLSTVRKFCSFCISQGWISTNPAKQIQNIKALDSQSDQSVDHYLSIYRYTLSTKKVKPADISDQIASLQEFFRIINS